MTNLKVKEPPFTGTAHQRAHWVFNALASVSFQKGKLAATDQIEEMLDTFRTARDKAIYSKMRELDTKISNVIQSVNQVRLVYLKLISELEGFTTFLLFIKETTQTLNEILHFVSSESDTETILKIIKSKPEFTIKDKVIVPDIASIRNSITPEKIFIEGVEIIKDKAQNQLSELLTFIEAIKDYCHKNKFRITVYDEMLNSFLTNCINEIPQNNVIITEMLGFELFPTIEKASVIPDRYAFYKYKILGDED